MKREERRRLRKSNGVRQKGENDRKGTLVDFPNAYNSTVHPVYIRVRFGGDGKGNRYGLRSEWNRNGYSMDREWR